MGINLYSLFVDLQAKGVGAVMADLRGVDAAGIKTAASLNGVSGSLDRAASAALNGTKGFRDNAAAYANQDKVLSTLTPATVASGKAVEEHAEKTKKATSAAKEHGETLHGLWGTVKQLAGAYFLFEGMHFIGEALESAAALHELSQKTGVTAETLSVLQFAGRRANVSIEQLGTAFKGMALSQGNLRDGVDKTVEAYQRLGFTADSFKGLSPEQTFIKLAIAVGNVKDETERAEVAQRVFGRSGSMLIPLFEDLARDGFAKATEEAEKFHAVISQKMADDADKTLDDWNDIKAMFAGMARETLPVLTIAVRALYEQLNVGFGDIWRNDLRDLAKLVDLWTAAMSLGMGGTNFASHFTAGHASFEDTAGGSSSSLDRPATPPKPVATPEEKAAAKQARENYIKRVLGLANMDESMRAPDKLGFQGVAATHLAIRGGGVGPLTPAAIGGGSAGDDFMGGSLGGDLEGIFAQGGSGKTGAGRMAILAAFANEAKRQAVQLKVQFATLGQTLGQTLANGFAAALSGAIQGKNVFKSFGNVVLQGLGSIFAQMGQSMIAAALPLIKLLPFLSNPLTAGPALLAAGIVLTALGATLGGIATGHGGSGGGSGGGDFRDRTTQITLTANGAGGLRAPNQQVGPTIHVLGKDSPEGQRIYGEYHAAAKRSRNV